MRTVIQRVSRASVTVDGEVTARIETGLLVLVGIGREDTLRDAEYLAGKIAALRIFPDGNGKMNRNVTEAGGAVVAVSQFTLYGDARRGNRPSFDDAAPPALAQPLYEQFLEALRKAGLDVGAGVFQAHMDVELVNDGPVTLVLDSRSGKP